MYMNNPVAGNAPGGGSANPLPNFSSPMFDQLSLGQFTMDIPTRHLSPSMGSARLSYQSLLPPTPSSSGHLQPSINMGMFAPVTNGNSSQSSYLQAQHQQQQHPTRFSQQQQQQRVSNSTGNDLKRDKARQKILSVTNNLANLERFSHQARSNNNNNNNTRYRQMDSHESSHSNAAVNSQSNDGLGLSSNTPEQTPSMVAPPGSGMVGSGYFGSPLLSNTMEFANRRLSPPSTNAILSSILPDTPAQPPAQMAPLDDAKFKKSAAVVSNLMNVERRDQKRKEVEHPSSSSSSSSPGSSVQMPQGGAGKGTMLAPPGLFAPLDQASLMRPPQGSQPSTGALLNSNMLRASRLSSSAGDDSFLDWNFNDMGGYTFSPGEMVRSLGPTGGGIPESPLTQSLRMFPYGATAPPPGYGSMMPPQGMSNANSWQYQQQPPPGQGAGRYNHSMLAMDQARQQHMMAPVSSSASANNNKKRSKVESRSNSSNKKSKSVKQDDPNEPRITSKHRGVCWYKRTKKWVVQTKVNGKRVHVGYFDDEEKAAQAYKEAVQSIQVRKALEAKQKAMEARQHEGGGGALSAPEQPTV